MDLRVILWGGGVVHQLGRRPKVNMVLQIERWRDQLLSIKPENSPCSQHLPAQMGKNDFPKNANCSPKLNFDGKAPFEAYLTVRNLATPDGSRLDWGVERAFF